MDEFKPRLEKLDGLKGKVDCVLLVNLDEPFKDVNYLYFTGNDSTYSVFVYDFSEARIMTNELELPKVERESSVRRINVFGKRGKLSDDIRKELGGAKRIGVNGIVPYFIAKNLGRKIVDVSEDLENIRAIKTRHEIKDMAMVCRVTSGIMEGLAGFIRPGVRESDIKRKIGIDIIANGCEPAFFDTIANSGRNSAIPHSIDSVKKIKGWEPVIVDFGCRYNGYHSDMTRMFCTGKFTGKMKEQYELLRSLMEELRDFIRPGTKASEVDSLARKRLKGYDKNFFFATGHGVGLLPHETPRITGKSKDILKEGMTFTIEPGMYFKDYGLRLEDTVLLTRNGVKTLTKSEK